MICLACYALLFFFGCDNIKMAGATMPYFNSGKCYVGLFISILSDVICNFPTLNCFTSFAANNQSAAAAGPFKINLTSSCNFGCECDMNDVQPVCGANGLTYFSPCHAGD